ncbi:Hypothetical_protein [Hexamita inflata]|uniref:Hypothetical_protein n=1 Tax=Hexamita inflata TaxID=28002 RepID=A0AA86QML2_9EUKA|nr:Hypothetical protein HINF_LOCUS50076 [Hexamita inflata]
MNKQQKSNQSKIDKIFAKSKIKQIDFEKLKSISSYAEFTSENQTFNNSFNIMQKRKSNQRIQLSKCLGKLWSSQINEKKPIYKYDTSESDFSQNTKNNTSQSQLVVSDLTQIKKLRCAEQHDSDEQLYEISLSDL